MFSSVGIRVLLGGEDVNISKESKRERPCLMPVLASPVRFHGRAPVRGLAHRVHDHFFELVVARAWRDA